MRLGITHTTLPAGNLAEAFSQAARLGAGGIEIDYPSTGMAAALKSPQHAEQLKRAAGESGVAIASLCLTFLRNEPALIGRPETIKRNVELVIRALGCAAEAGADMVVLPFFGKNTIEVEDELTRATGALLDLVEHAEEAGVVLAVESTLPFHQQEYLLTQFGKTGDVKVCCNTAVATARKLDAPTGLRKLGADALAMVRFNDVKIVEGAAADYAVQFGTGNVDFGAVVQALRAIGYDGWTMVQPPEAHDGPSIGATQTSLEFIAHLLKD